MIVVYLILLAVIQAVVEFLPVSSMGHLCALEQLMGINHGTGLLLEAILHLGTAAAIIFLFRKDLKKIALELLGMFMDLIGNLNIYIYNKRTGKNLNYARIVTGTYRKLGALLVISMIPTALLGFTGRRLALLAADSPIVPGIGFLLTGVLLLVTDLNKSGGKKVRKRLLMTAPCGLVSVRDLRFFRAFQEWDLHYALHFYVDIIVNLRCVFQYL